MNVAIAWLALLAAGLSMGLTGELDWRGVFGEYIVEYLALGAAGFVLWACGRRTTPEWLAARCTVLTSLLVALAAWFLGAWYWPMELALHLLLVAQLAAWFRAAGDEAWPVGVMLAGMAVECGNLLWKMAADPPLPADCLADPNVGMWLSCAASSYAAMALPFVMTLVMLPWFAGLSRWGGRS